MEIEERFAEKFQPEPNTGCWLWQASVNNKGYGKYWYAGRLRLAHRVSYEWKHGPVSEGMEVDHRCRQPLCVNPDHLEAVPHLENVRRGEAGKWQTEKTHCPHGHPYTERNTVWLKNGSRTCRECRYQNHQNQRNGKGRDHNRLKDHCPQGHPYSGDNLYVKPDGRRVCRECVRKASREHQRRKKAKP